VLTKIGKCTILLIEVEIKLIGRHEMKKTEKEMAMMKKEQAPKFKVGDKVTFINDYGIKFPNKTITKIEFIQNEPRYYLEPMDAYWFPNYEKNLRLES
jgi:hypothetical protein